MSITRILAEVGKSPGTAKQIHARCAFTSCTEASMVALLHLYRMGKVTRRKEPQASGRAQFVYAIADEAASQA
jgi:predicted transcriptional regulator